MPRKGTVNNPKGRTPGTKNEKTKQWEKLGEAIITKHADRFNEVLEKLDEVEFIKAYGLILQYFKPKQTHNINEEVNPTIVFQDVSGKEIEKPK